MTPVERLFALEHFGIKLGLDAMRVVLAALDNPHERWPALHVAGTNGKGSTSAMVEQALRHAGLSTGRYTSPHLVRVEERVTVDGKDVTTGQFDDALARVFSVVDRLVARGDLAAMPTFFEISTAAAFLIFADDRVDVGVVEVGLGGRHDATNVITPRVAGITSIDFDHERHLGTTLGAIAGEKAGIAKPDVPLIVGPVGDEARQAIERTAGAVGARLEFADAGTTVESRMVDGHVRLLARTPVGIYGPVRVALGGAHQAGNALVAIRMIEAFAAATGHAITPADVEAGLARATWPARLEWLVDRRTGTRVLVDAAHNPAGARALASYLDMVLATPATLVTSVMADKDIPGVIGPILPHVHRVIVTAADTRRAMPAAELAKAVALLAQPGTSIEVVDGAWPACQQACKAGGPVVLAGSIYLVGPLRGALLASGFEPA